jgi:hypothetical protein
MEAVEFIRCFQLLRDPSGAGAEEATQFLLAAYESPLSIPCLFDVLAGADDPVTCQLSLYGLSTVLNRQSLDDDSIAQIRLLVLQYIQIPRPLAVQKSAAVLVSKLLTGPWPDLFDDLNDPQSPPELVIVFLAAIVPFLEPVHIPRYLAIIGAAFQNDDLDLVGVDFLLSLAVRFPDSRDLLPFLSEVLAIGTTAIEAGETDRVAEFLRLLLRSLDHGTMVFAFEDILSLCCAGLAGPFPPTLKIMFNRLLAECFPEDQSGLDNVDDLFDLEVRVAVELCQLNGEDPAFLWSSDVSTILEMAASDLAPDALLSLAVTELETLAASDEPQLRFAGIIAVSALLVTSPSTFGPHIDDFFTDLLGLLADSDSDVANMAGQQLGVLADTYPDAVEDHLEDFIKAIKVYAEREPQFGFLLLREVLESVSQSDSVFADVYPFAFEGLSSDNPIVIPCATRALCFLIRTSPLQSSLRCDEIFQRLTNLLETGNAASGLMVLSKLCFACPHGMDEHAPGLSEIAFQFLRRDDADAQEAAIGLISGLLQLNYDDWIGDGCRLLHELVERVVQGASDEPEICRIACLALVSLGAIAGKTQDPYIVGLCLQDIAAILATDWRIGPMGSARAFQMVATLIDEQHRGVASSILDNFVALLAPGRAENERLGQVMEALEVGFVHVGISAERQNELATYLRRLIVEDAAVTIGESAPMAGLIHSLADEGHVEFVQALLPVLLEAVSRRNRTQKSFALMTLSSIFVSPVAAEIDPDESVKVKFLDIVLEFVKAAPPEIARSALRFIELLAAAANTKLLVLRFDDILTVMRDRLVAAIDKATVANIELRETLVYTMTKLAKVRDMLFPYEECLPLILEVLPVRRLVNYVEPILRFLNSITPMLRQYAARVVAVFVSVLAHRFLCIAMPRTTPLVAATIRILAERIDNMQELVVATLENDPAAIQEFQANYQQALEEERLWSNPDMSGLQLLGPVVF